MLRNLLVISMALGATASFAAVGDPCTAADGLHCNPADGKILGCGTSNTIVEQDCNFPNAGGTNTIVGGTCAPETCTDSAGDGCNVFQVTEQDTCRSPDGQPCSGLAVWLDTDTTNNNNIGFPACANDEACVTGGTAEVCTAGIPQCTAIGLGCAGNVVSVCLLGASEDTNGNGTLDAGEDKDGDGTIDSFISPQPMGLDCATAFTKAGTCNATATSGPMHTALTGLGVNVGTQAIADCDIPAEGEGEGGAGEGEGEGASGACTTDANCDRNQVCTNGVCKTADDSTQPAPTCANGGFGTPMMGLLGLLGLLPLLRRRRG